MNRRGYVLIGIFFLLLGTVLVSIPLAQSLPNLKAAAASSFFDRLGLAGGFEQELKPGEYISIKDEKTGTVLDRTSRVVYVGDEIITESNEHYRVNRVKGNLALAGRLGPAVGMVRGEEPAAALVAAGFNGGQADLGKTQVAIYHTHSDESYVPTDGTDAMPAVGGILKVGSALVAELKSKGVAAVDDKTPHEPHDANAYHRSRRTAVNLIKKRPVALLDVHRDGVPNPDFYNESLQGQAITKIRLVVGRQNPNMAANLAFAKSIKAYMDEHKPGLIKGIFLGKGDYNQDLSPRALLLEVGTHTNDRYRAEKGAALFADAFPAVLKIKPAGQPGGGPGKTFPFSLPGGESRSIWSTIGWIIGIVLIVGAVFLFISTGSIAGMKNRLRGLGRTEFADFFGSKRVSRKRPDSDQEDR